MATRRHKITRSAVRRVKRRESKNAKLRSHRSRKNARKYSTAKNKRINLREMRGGVKMVAGVKVKVVAGSDSFFTIYKVKVVSIVNRQSNDIGILFYNHKTKNFYLFIQTYDNDGDVIKFITGLCGFSGNLGTDHLLYPGSIDEIDPDNFKYYLTFDSSEKKLYFHVARSDEQITKQELDFVFDPAKTLIVPPIENVPKEVTSEGIKFTLVKAFGNETSENDYFSEKWHDVTDKAKLKTALERAYEASEMIDSIRNFRYGDSRDDD